MKRDEGAVPSEVNAGTEKSGGGSMFERTTRQIKISVQAAFLADQSAPDNNHFFWAYTVLIENGGLETVQLRARYWRRGKGCELCRHSDDNLIAGCNWHIWFDASGTMRIGFDLARCAGHQAARRDIGHEGIGIDHARAQQRCDARFLRC